MIDGFSRNKSVQLTIALLKAHNVKRIIISPGTTNLELTAGLQFDGSFQLYSAVDERSAAYMACGIASECNEPIVITCTEATASRNYYPGITEAYYRKLPVLAITGVHRYSQIGNLIPQIIDRSVSPSDTFVGKYRLPIIKDDEDYYQTQILLNEAILDLKRPNCGPVHIDLPCCNDTYDFSVKELPEVKVIERYYSAINLPQLPNGKIAIFIGSHKVFSESEIAAIDMFCKEYDSVVFCDHTSGYKGNFAVYAGLLSVQRNAYDIFNNIDLVIHIGEHAGDTATMAKLKSTKEVWRLSDDGKLRDTFHKLTKVFAMSVESFFLWYSSSKHYDMGRSKESYYMECVNAINTVLNKVGDIPFSNIYISSKIAPRLPEGSTIHLGVSNTIRAWSLFEFPKSVFAFSNVGCRGIDGALSSTIGAAQAFPLKIHFCIVGDLSFFYDLNSIGNRGVKNNLRILLINNNGGNVFKHENAPGYKYFGDDTTGEFIAASGHFGCKSKTLVKHFANDLGIKYITACNKEEFDCLIDSFLNPDISQSILFEVFTDDKIEREAFNLIEMVDASSSGKVKLMAKQLLGNKGERIVKHILKK